MREIIYYQNCTDLQEIIQTLCKFGVLKQDWWFKRFLTGGKKDTETQFFILAFAFII